MIEKFKVHSMSLIIDVRYPIYETILDFISKWIYAEVLTFVWVVNPGDVGIIRNLITQKDNEGKTGFVEFRNNMYFMLNRPVFFSEEAIKGVLLFRSYV